MAATNSNTDDAKAHANDSPPWAATACLLLALVSLGVSDEAMARATMKANRSLQEILPIVLAIVAILASRLMQGRMQRNHGTAWMLRLAAYSGSIFFAYATTEHIQAFYYINFIARVAGLIFVVEGAIQHWVRPTRGRPRGAILVFLAAIIFVLASRTFIPYHIKFLTPPFIAMLVLSMRASRSRSDSAGLQPWLAAIMLAMLLGGVAALSVAAHSAELTRIMMALLKPSSYSEVSDVNARPMLGRRFNSPLSPRRVMRIEGKLFEQHMRGMAFETYATGGGWGPAVEGRAHEDGSVVLKARAGGQRLTVTPMLDNLSVLYVPLHMDGLDAKSYHVLWAREWGGPIYATTTLRTYEPYEVAVVNESHRGPLCDVMNERVRERCLDLPPDFDPRLRDIAKTIGKNAATTAEKMEAVRKFLYTNNEYSLEIDPGPGDPVVNFLVQKMKGHCQFFASSSVLLLRGMNVPARYVSGYFVHERPEDDVSIVRQRDAHAWAEVWLDDQGWVTFDATPPAGMPGQSGSVSRWERLWEKLGDAAEAVGEWLHDGPLHLVLLAGGIVIAVILIRWTRAGMAAAREKAGPKIKYTSAGQSFEALAAAFDDYLKRRGAPCPRNRPWKDHLNALRSAKPREGELKTLAINFDQAAEFVLEYSAARFGAEDESALAELRGKLAAIQNSKAN
ncbi:MAG TPA: transglutaminase family protein [Planctomycetota bacterium]|nr:transglutaminase family protein [Planctomycetota bacterium]